jgi:hypothetical protein
VYEIFEQRGYTKKLTGTYLVDFPDSVNTGTGPRPLLYAIQDQTTGQFVKIGYTTDLEYRKTQYNNPNYFFVILGRLDLLDDVTEERLRQVYREMMDEIISHAEAPAPIRELFSVIVNKGGEGRMQTQDHPPHVRSWLSVALPTTRPG